MKIIHDFKKYITPRKAIYFATGNNYLKDPETGLYGWERIKYETLVIGETKESYIEKLSETTICDTTNAYYGKNVLVPHGFHKSRLIQWIPMAGEQIKLFN